MTATAATSHRHNLVLPERVHRELTEVAERRGITTTELIRTCLKVGLVVLAVEEDPDSELFIRENGAERKLLIV